MNRFSVPKPGPWKSDPHTEGQRIRIAELLAERKGIRKAENIRTALENLTAAGAVITKGKASEVITALEAITPNEEKEPTDG